MVLYFSLLPTDLLPPLFLFFDSRDLLVLLPKLKKLPSFNTIFNSNIFWRKLWRRDISSFMDIPSNPYETYREIFDELSILPHKFDRILYLAKRGYDILLLPLLSNKYDYSSAMRGAAEGGHMLIVKSMLSRGADNYDDSMMYAAESGHIDIVELMLQKGANEYDVTMWWAARGGQMKIVELMMSLGANDYDKTMQFAAVGGHIRIIKLMLEKGATDYNATMRLAAIYGHTDIVKLMLEKGATDYDQALSVAKTKEIRDLIESYQNR